MLSPIQQVNHPPGQRMKAMCANHEYNGRQPETHFPKARGYPLVFPTSGQSDDLVGLLVKTLLVLGICCGTLYEQGVSTHMQMMRYDTVYL